MEIKKSKPKIECLGVKEEYVYDIEVEGTHTFFGNDILVHNSVYINLAPLVESILPDETDKEKIVSFLDTFSEKKLSKIINDSDTKMFDYLNNRELQMVMNRENIADNAIWTKKKRYCMNILDKEGIRKIDNPSLKIMGIEVVRSSTPAVCREKLKECIRIMLQEDEKTLINYIQAFKKEFKTLPPERIAFPRGVSEIGKWVDNKGNIKSGIPIHVRGSVIFNTLLEKHNLAKDIPKIKDSDSILFTYLKMPNPTHGNVIAFHEKLFPEFTLDQYVDYDLQFEKSFIDPLKNLTDVIGWHTKKVNVLDVF